MKSIVEKVTMIYLQKNSENIGSILYKLINENTKFKRFAEDIENILPFMQEEEAEDISKLLHKMRKTLLGINAFRMDSLEKMQHIYDELVEYENALKQCNVSNTNITLSYSENSMLFAGGNVFVTGCGSYQSNVIAKNSVIFKDPASVVLGGMLVAGKKIKVGTVGSPIGVNTYCKIVNADGEFDAAYCYPGTILNINNKKQKSLFLKRGMVV